MHESGSWDEWLRTRLLSGGLASELKAAEGKGGWGIGWGWREGRLAGGWGAGVEKVAG